MRNIYFFGDSIAFGQGVSICDTWVCKTAEYLRNHVSENIVVNNHSINGNTTRMALERMPHDIQDKSIDILVVEFGMNDCNYWVTDCGVPRVSEEAFRANLTEIIERALVFHVKKILLLTNHISGRMDIMPNSSITYQQSNKKYNLIIREVAQRFGAEKVVLVDMEKYFEEGLGKENDNIKNRENIRKSLLLPDLVHLSKKGHELYYRHFLRTLLQMLDYATDNLRDV